MNPLVGLKFMLDHGVWLTALVTRQEGKEIVQNWMSGQYRLKGTKIIGSDSPPPGGWLWAVEVDAVRAVHSFDPNELLQAAQAQRGSYPTAMSGIAPLHTPTHFAR